MTTLAWDELVAAATVGTDRRQSTVDDAAARLLDDAAVAVVSQRAGVQPHAPTPPTPAPDEPLPPAPAGAQLRLATLLAQGGEQQLDLVAEWLSLAVTVGRRAAPEQLPALLDLGRRSRELRPDLLGAGGARIAWLARQRTDWGYLTQVPDEQVEPDASTWLEGTAGQRIGYLRSLRRRDQAAGLELLRSQWPSLVPDERAALIAVLDVGLSDTDERFLDAALDDRRKEVRSAAADLLIKLPESGYATRMVERARTAVALTGPGGVTITAPAECDKSMRRDGITPKPPAGVGERAWWLEELLARTPLGCWDLDLTDRAVDPDWATVLWQGLARAVASQQSAEWAQRLLPILAAKLGPQAAPNDRLLVEALHPVLAPQQRVAAALAMIEGDPAAAGLDRLLDLCPGPWPEALTRAVLDKIRTLAEATKPRYQLDGLCRIAGLRMAPDTAHRAAALWAEVADAHPDDYWRAGLRKLAETLRLRAEMIREMNLPLSEEHV